MVQLVRHKGKQPPCILQIQDLLLEAQVMQEERIRERRLNQHILAPNQGLEATWGQVLTKSAGLQSGTES